MISERERDIIIQFAKQYKISLLLLFGSAVDSNDYNDIDLAVRGLKPELFFKFYGELLRALEKPVDLVDLSEESLFNKIIEERGVKIFG